MLVNVSIKRTGQCVGRYAGKCSFNVLVNVPIKVSLYVLTNVRANVSTKKLINVSMDVSVIDKRAGHRADKCPGQYVNNCAGKCVDKYHRR